ncbi:hypothetical protein PTKIN_Ptkin02bG0077100 [Pterospermum kingtungense]
MEVAISVVVVASLFGSSCGCPFPAIYNFGDSNSDTGSASAAFGFSTISLDIQLLQFEQLKERTNQLYEEAKNPDYKDRLPRLEEFSKALYTLDIGQNDLTYGLVTTTEEQDKESIPHIISQFALAIEKLYNGGARIFWIHNTGPIGCLPIFVIKYPPNLKTLTQLAALSLIMRWLKNSTSSLKTRFLSLGSISLVQSLYMLIST